MDLTHAVIEFLLQNTFFEPALLRPFYLPTKSISVIVILVCRFLDVFFSVGRCEGNCYLLKVCLQGRQLLLMRLEIILEYGQPKMLSP